MGILHLGNGPVLKRKVTDIATINFVGGAYKWNGLSELRISDVTSLDEFDKLRESYRFYRMVGMQMIFTKRFAFDIPLSGDDSKIASALAFNVYPTFWNGADPDFRYGDSTKIVPVTLFGVKTFNIDFHNILDVTQWKKVAESTNTTIQIAPVTQIPITDEVNIPVFDVIIHYNIEFTQPI
jgi:hypothetical protein